MIMIQCERKGGDLNVLRFLFFVVFALFLFAAFTGSIAAEKTARRSVPDSAFSQVLQKHFAIYTNNPAELAVLDGDDVHAIDTVLKRTQEKRDEIQRLLKSGNASFHGTDRIINDQAPILHYVKIELAVAKRSLQTKHIDQSVESLRNMIRLTHFLCAANQYDLRLTAARIRLQTIIALQDIFLNPGCTKQIHQDFFELLEFQLAHWTKDKTIWLEYLDEGKKIFGEAELKKDEQLVIEKKVFEKAMRAVIESCQFPFYKRQPVLRQLEIELKKHSEPTLADGLLKEVAGTMELLATERTQCEMVFLALSIAIHGRNQQHCITPLTGEEYNIKLLTDGVMITYPGNPKAVYLPYR
ncbi:hypothetical protein FACS189454_05120 [Planctomycetales bacterium]|nr:hypothetical protein FACS189454_05120 [Planctomycetales bacterium]